jgi:hypothetical protein
MTGPMGLWMVGAPTFVAGYILKTVGSFLYFSYWKPFLNAFQSSVTIHNDDPNFNGVMDYLTDLMEKQAKTEGFVSGSQANLRASTAAPKDKKKGWLKRMSENMFGTTKREEVKLDYRPDSDQVQHELIYTDKRGKKWTLAVTRVQKGTTLMGSYSDKPFTPEFLTLQCYSRDNTVLKEILSEV